MHSPRSVFSARRQARASSRVAELLIDGDRIVQQWADLALRIIDRDALKQIVSGRVDLLSDDEPKVRREAAALLWRLDPGLREAFPHLKRLINDPDPDVGRWVAMALWAT